MTRIRIFCWLEAWRLKKCRMPLTNKGLNFFSCTLFGFCGDIIGKRKGAKIFWSIFIRRRGGSISTFFESVHAWKSTTWLLE